MSQEVLSIRETKKLIAQAASQMYGKEIKPEDIKFNFKEGTRTVGLFTDEHTEKYKELTGITITK